MDVVALAQSGFGNAVATLGTACTAEHVQKLVRFTDSVVFSFDGDAAGRRAAGARARGEPAARQRHAHLPLPVPAGRARPRQLRARARRRRRSSRRSPQAVPLSRQIVARAGEDVDLATAEGRARFLANARPLWSALPDGMLKRQLLGEIASRGGAADRRARRRLAGAGRARRERAAAPTAAGAPAAPPRRGAPAADAPAGRPRRLDAAARERLVGAAERRRPRRCSAPCPAGTASCSASSTASRPSTARSRGRRCASGIGGRALGARSALALVDAEDPAIEPLARGPARARSSQLRVGARAQHERHARSGPDLTRHADAVDGIIEGFRDRGNVTAAPPGPGHPLIEGHPPRPPFPARAAASDGRTHRGRVVSHPATARPALNPEVRARGPCFAPAIDDDDLEFRTKVRSSIAGRASREPTTIRGIA